jgi:plastocyanin
MQRYYKQALMFCLLLLCLLSACAGLQQQVGVEVMDGEKVVAIKASSFKFKPNNIKAFKGDVITFKIENISGAGHNFTITDPRGQTIQSVDLPCKKTIEFKITLSENGTYNFYCDKTFHSLFGMKGQIEVQQ